MPTFSARGWWFSYCTLGQVAVTHSARCPPLQYHHCPKALRGQTAYRPPLPPCWHHPCIISWCQHHITSLRDKPLRHADITRPKRAKILPKPIFVKKMWKHHFHSFLLVFSAWPVYAIYVQTSARTHSPPPSRIRSTFLFSSSSCDLQFTQRTVKDRYLP